MKVSVQGITLRDVDPHILADGVARIHVTVNGYPLVVGDTSAIRFVDGGLCFELRPPPTSAPSGGTPRQDEGKR